MRCGLRGFDSAIAVVEVGDRLVVGRRAHGLSPGSLAVVHGLVGAAQRLCGGEVASQFSEHPRRSASWTASSASATRRCSRARPIGGTVSATDSRTSAWGNW